jgi:hypothetical protein
MRLTRGQVVVPVRRAHIMFGGLSDKAMEEIIQRGSKDAFTHEEWDEEGEEGGEEEPPFPIPAAKKKALTNKKKAGSGGRGPKWRTKEGECLAEAWEVVSIDPFIGVNQKSDTYCSIYIFIVVIFM